LEQRIKKEREIEMPVKDPVFFRAKKVKINELFETISRIDDRELAKEYERQLIIKECPPFNNTSMAGI